MGRGPEYVKAGVPWKCALPGKGGQICGAVVIGDANRRKHYREVHGVLLSQQKNPRKKNTIASLKRANKGIYPLAKDW